ncbi:MAG TPA: ATP-binding protein [Cytophagales bacterium]|nr:ATP-binding protein [Cytophagales bacterium]
MLLNSRAVALLIASSIAVITTGALSLSEGITENALFLCCILSFFSSFILIYYTLEFLIFREINKIYQGLEKINKRDFSFNKKGIKNASNPFKRINQEIHSYATIKQQEIDELKKLEVFRREFLADVSHELKTPIFAAQGFVHTLLDGAIEDKKVRTKFLKKAAKNLDGLNMLVQDLLTISQMEAGEIKMHKEKFDIRQTVLDIFDQLEEKAQKKQIVFKMEEEAPVYVYADARRIHQVMVNLITNSIKYGKEFGHVSISFLRDKGHIAINIKDDGMGIPSEHLKRIFERFYRVEKSRSKDKGGTGLGLAIVKHIIEAHGSKVAVVSSVKKGSTFTFKLDKAKESDEARRVQELDII